MNNSILPRMATACVLLTTACLSTTALAHDGHSHARPDDHAPIGVMRDHVHKQGEWMLSYRYSYMNMEQNQDGANTVSDAAVLQDYNVAPTDMTMRMHMIGAMYGITDQWTLGVMGGFAEKSMDHLRRNGTTFEMEAESFTDTTVNAMYQFYKDDMHRVQFNAGISLPTGEDDERKPNGQPFAYAMQYGSGTYDLKPGISYSGLYDDISWGAQANATLRLGRNSQDYSFGDVYQLTGWGAYRLNDMFSVSARLDGRYTAQIDGTDSRLTNFMAPPMDSGLYEHTVIDGLVGVNMLIPQGVLAGHRFAIEGGAPIYEHTDRFRLDTDYRVMIGWQKAF